MENSRRFLSLVGIKELPEKTSYQRSICNKEKEVGIPYSGLRVNFSASSQQDNSKITQNTDDAKKRCLLYFFWCN